jgi:copper transport protein
VRRLALAVLGALFLLVYGAGAASAHASLQSSTPAQGSVLKASPGLVTLHLSEPVGTALSAISVLDAAGHDVAAGDLLRPGNAPTDLAVAVPPQLADGTYLVVWRAVSDDSHPTTGQFSFSVGTAGQVATAVSPGPDPTVGALLGFGRLLGFVGVATFLGGVAFLVLCWPSGRTSSVARRTLAGGWLLALAGALSTFLLQGPYGAGLSLSHVFDGALINGVAGTPYGTALLVRLGLLVLTAAVAWLVVRRVDRRIDAAFGVVAVATLVTFPYTGHPSVGSQVPLAVVSDLLHLVAMCVWFGGLLQLAVVVLPDEQPDVVRTAATRFSRYAMASVVLLVATGLYQAWREAGIAGSLTATHYGRLLLVKTAIVVGVLLVAQFSRRWVGSATAGVRGLGLTVSLETAMVVVVLAVTSLLVTGVPARTDYRPASDLHLATGSVHLELSVRPTATRVVDVRVDSTDASGRPLELKDLALSLQLGAPATGPLTVHLAAIGSTQFQATDVELPYTGQWAVILVATTVDTVAHTARVNLDVR